MSSTRSEGSADPDVPTAADASNTKPETPEARRKRIRLKNEEIRERNIRIEHEQQLICLRRRATKPQVSRVGLEHFKNRYSWTPTYQEYAVEVLVGPWDLRSQYREEKKRREPAFKVVTKPGMLATYDFLGFGGGWGPDTNVDADANRDQAKRTNVTQAVDSTDEYIHRIRVHSTPVLGYLTRLIGDDVEQDLPRTFMRPFMSLIVFQESMRKSLAVLEEKWAAAENDGDLATANQPLDEDTCGKEKQTPLCDDKIGMDGQSAPLVHNLLEDAYSGEGIVGTSTTQEDDPTIVKDDQEIDINSGHQPDSNDDSASVYTTSRESLKFDNDENKTYVEETMHSAEALLDMRCYVDFIDHEIIPHYLALRGNSEDKVLFDDLWCLFHSGDIVYRQKTDQGDKSRPSHELWRVYEVEVPEMEHTTSYDFHFGLRNGPSMTNGAARERRQRLNLTCYALDFDGNSYGAVRETFYMHYFPERKSIRSLQVYPLRFVKNQDAVLAASRSTGKKYHGALTQRHQSYHNWTLTTQSGTFPEFIDSHVIVDFEETFRKEPDWRPQFHYSQRKRDESESQFGWCHDPWSISYHTDQREAAVFYHSQNEVLTLEDPIFKWQRQNFCENDSFLRTQTVEDSYDDFDGPPTTIITSDDLALLPKRAYAYTLRERRFVSIDINHLRPIIAEGDVLQRLKISSQYKDILRGLVSSHFQKKELERLYLSHSMEGISQDLISGKGKGLVILLHGAPGVGKTATAESVAIENKKPLFSITCGDLGLTPSEVESKLVDIFRLAHKWDCVLLLDEADIFLSQRSRTDLKRNALVSVFLRVLEYYNGLLFLTTNRVGTIDEAFKSRIHMSLYYAPLKDEQTIQIFRLNIGKLREIERQKSALTKQPELIINEDDIINFAHQHLKQRGASWNGRQIRNAFQVASSLAHYDYQKRVQEALEQRKTPPPRPELNSEFFRKVQHATNTFDMYMTETKGWSDAEYSHKQGERSDHVQPTHFPRDGAQYPPDQAAATGGPQYARPPSQAGLFSESTTTRSFANLSQNSQTYGHAAVQANHWPVQGQFGGSPQHTPVRYNSSPASQAGHGQMMQEEPRQGFLSPPSPTPAVLRSADGYNAHGQRSYEVPIIGGRPSMTTGASVRPQDSETMRKWNEGGADGVGTAVFQMHYGQSSTAENLHD